MKLTMLLAKGLITIYCKNNLKNAHPENQLHVRKRLKTLLSVGINSAKLKVLPVRMKHKLLNRRCGQNVKHAVKQQRTTTRQVRKDSAE
jgi:hypothetical protein